jgi:hypothetical protein
VSATSSQSKQLKAFSRILEERATLLGLQEMDLEVCEAILAEELERDVHPPDGQDPSTELDKVCASVGRISNDRVAKAEWLSQQVAHVAGPSFFFSSFLFHHLTWL